MITESSSIPKRSKKGLLGQEILWSQFNDISIFIEDDYQENLYFQIFKKLFPNILIGKIFPLGGKDFVIKKAEKSLTNNKRVFIVDNDFDEILKIKTSLPNLFYLDRYSIENYIFESNAIFEIIREENTKIKLADIKVKFNLSDLLNDFSSILSELSAHFFLIRKFKLGIKYLNIDPGRDCDLRSIPKQLKTSSVQAFFLSVKVALKGKHPRLKYQTQLNLVKKHFKPSKVIKNVPGKYLANLLKTLLKKSFTFVQCTCDSFIYRLMKNCNLLSLTFIKEAINLYTTTSLAV